MATSFDQLIAQAEQRPFTGWDVDYDGRIASTLPWDFTAIVAAHAGQSPDLLDMGTGGGEWLASLPCRPPRTMAIEGWPPNVAIARKRLGPLGVAVLSVDAATPNAEQGTRSIGGHLPFNDRSFHLVSNRHEAFLAAEVRRVLAPDGLFLTQQVGSGASDDYYRLFGEAPPIEPVRWTLALARRQLEAAGLTVEEAAEGHEEMHFADVGAFAWYLKNLPFVFPGFSIEQRRGRLAALHGQGAITVRMPSFWLKARRP